MFVSHNKLNEGRFDQSFEMKNLEKLSEGMNPVNSKHAGWKSVKSSIRSNANWERLRK